MTEKPILDYAPKPALPTWRRRAGSISLAIARVLAVASVLLWWGIFILRVTKPHLLVANEIIFCQKLVLIGNLAGLISAVIAAYCGKARAGLTLFLLLLLNFLVTGAMPVYT